jgi:hypothetical protein
MKKIMNDRYKNRPLVRLLECFVLKAIGQLPQEDESKLDTMTPKLEQTYNLNGSWDEIVMQIMKFPNDMSQQISIIWEKNCKLAEENNEVLIPQHFAEIFVDHNFV